ncbi:MAG: hypothetical protein J5662_06935, partial [Clostridia bacterium]|nr:hypothetical protein [Clostridia bacterium]
MKDVNVLSAQGKKAGRSEIFTAILYHTAAAAVGFVLCRAVFLKSYVPFGVSFAAGCLPGLLPGAAAGVFIGYFLPAVKTAGFKYVAAALAVLAVRFMLSFNKKLVSNPLFAALICALSLTVTGAVTRTGQQTNPLFFCLEVLICSVAAAVISRTSGFISRIDRGITSEELAFLSLTVSTVLAGLYGISFFGVRPACVLAVAVILSASKYGGALSGTVSAIAFSVMFLFAGESVQSSFTYTACALFGGLVLTYGKYAQLCAFFTCGVFFSLFGELNALAAAFITEIALGCILFALCPKSAGIYLARVFTCFPRISVNNDLNRAAALRLKEAAQGIKDVKTTVDEVAARLEGINTPSFSDVLSAAEREACAGCKMRSGCWEAKRQTTLDAVFSIIKQI